MRGNAREALRRVAGALSSPAGGAVRGVATARAGSHGPPVLPIRGNNPDRGGFAPPTASHRALASSRRPGPPRGSAGAGPTFAASPFLATIPRDDDGDARGRGEGANAPIRRRLLHASSRAHLAAKLPTSAKQSAKAAAALNAPGGTDRANDARETFDRGVGFERSAVDVANDKRALHAVNVAMYSNAAIFLCKAGAYAVTGSSAMLAEAVHSVADIVNQGLLHVGISSSAKAPDAKYNYGYRRERFVWSLISAVGVFFMGSGVSVMHGVHNIMHPAPLEHIWIGIGVLGASAAIDSYSLHVAYEALKANARAKGMSLDEFVRSGHDPTSVAVVAEDAAAVAGCAIAGGALAATQHFGTSVFDAAGSIAVGGLLGTTAMYLINSNRLLLLGRSLGPEKMRRITDAVRADPVVEEVYRAKSEELGPGTYRFVAEIEFSGTRVVERYLDQGDGAKREQLHGVFRSAVEEGNGSGDPRALDAALKLYGEEVVTAVGDEVDRIEKAIVRVEPTIHYVDLETN